MKSIFLVLSPFFISLYFCMPSKAQVLLDFRGVNLTGCERVWEDRKLNGRHALNSIKNAEQKGFNAFRLPLAVDELIKNDRRFLKELRKLVKYTEKTGTPLILAYFNHGLDNDNWKTQSNKLAENWLEILKHIPNETKYVYLELANEPTLNPDYWEEAAISAIGKIREVSPTIPIIVGASNYNSLFELSRTKPLPFDHLIYTFHFYEPYLFTHQGTEWTGPQNATIGIPYPYSAPDMPKIHPDALGTDGEINYRDYEKTGDINGMVDKISIIANWAKKHQVSLMCTEYGVSQNADEMSRVRYLNDLGKTLREFQIPGFVWEWRGNFGIEGIAEEVK